jgi:hypothetical protein
LRFEWWKNNEAERKVAKGMQSLHFIMAITRAMTAAGSSRTSALGAAEAEEPALLGAKEERLAGL